jgi:hypothetical protein
VASGCGQWATESRDNTVRLAFRQMAMGWARVAFSEEFTSAADDDQRRPESDAEPIPAGKLALFLSPPPSENAQPESTQPVTGRRARVRLSLPLRTLFPKLWGKPLSRRAANI